MSDRTNSQRNRPSPELPDYTWGEIGAHNRRADCWIVIDDFVYDVTRWIDRHPGGDIICSLVWAVICPFMAEKDFQYEHLSHHQSFGQYYRDHYRYLSLLGRGDLQVLNAQ